MPNEGSRIYLVQYSVEIGTLIGTLPSIVEKHTTHKPGFFRNVILEKYYS